MKIIVLHSKNISKDQLAYLRQLCKGEQLDAQFHPLNSRLHNTVAQAVAAGCKIAVAAGGDGTVNAVANCVMQHDQLVLAVLPLGTLNHFARDIGMPVELDAAVKIIRQRHIAKLDIACFSNRYFVNNMSFGLYPRLVKTRESHEARFGKWPALALAYIRLLPRMRRYRMSINYDNKTTKTYRAASILISNNAYAVHSAQFTRRTSLQAGELAIYILETLHWRDLLRATWRMLSGKHTAKVFTVHKAHTVVLRRQNGKQLLLAYDGEVITKPQASVTCRILPQKLRVIVPLQPIHQA